MRIMVFIRDIFVKFPRLLIANTILLITVSLLSACSLLTISPLVDFLFHPDLRNISPLTAKAVSILIFLGLPATLECWLIVFLVFIALSSVFLIFARYSILKTRYAVLRDLMVGTFESFFNARWYFFSSSAQGVLLNTFSRELDVVGNAFISMGVFFTSMFQVLVYLIIPFYLSWQVTCISLCSALILTIPFLLTGKLSYRLGVINTATSNKMISIIHEDLSLAKVVLGFAKQQKAVDDLGSAFDAHRAATIKSQVLAIATCTLYSPLAVIIVGIALFAARRLEVPLSETVVLLVALRQIAVSIGDLVTQKNTLENFFASYEQIKSLRQKALDLKQDSGGVEFKGFVQGIYIEGVSFAYPEQRPLLVDINAHIPKGKMVAFVGKSGAGKSTLIDLIMGFHKPAKGRIKFDNTKLQDFDILSYRRKIGYVPQDSVLFNTTIRDNFLWVCESATDGEIMQACRQANADEFIKRLPDGYSTLVGDRGVRLSGGQIQRIALARAILRKPELLILDEATSALDTHSEQLIQQAVENISKETTVVVIAHRLSTIVNADYIYVLDMGRIVEDGTYSDLVKANGYFNNMVKLQMLGANRK